MKLRKDWDFQDEEYEEYENAYNWIIICENCKHKNYISVKKGIKVPLSITCENCGCNTSEIFNIFINDEL